MSAPMTPAEQEVVDVNAARIHALIAGDVETLAQYVGEDLVYVSAAGTTHPRTEVFDSLRSGNLRLEKQDPREVTVRIYGDTAIAGYLADSVTITHGERIEATTRCTSIYVRRDGRWVLVLQHNTYA